MQTAMHMFVRCEFHNSMLRYMSQHEAFDEATARVHVQHPELSTAAARRLVAVMLSNEPLDIRDIAELASVSGMS